MHSQHREDVIAVPLEDPLWRRTLCIRPLHLRRRPRPSLLLLLYYCSAHRYCSKGASSTTTVASATATTKLCLLLLRRQQHPNLLPLLMEMTRLWMTLLLEMALMWLSRWGGGHTKDQVLAAPESVSAKKLIVQEYHALQSLFTDSFQFPIWDVCIVVADGRLYSDGIEKNTIL